MRFSLEEFLECLILKIIFFFVGAKDESVYSNDGDLILCICWLLKPNIDLDVSSLGHF